MRFVVFISILLLSSQASFAQHLDSLEKKRSFKDIRLDTAVNIYEGLEFKKLIADKENNLEEVSLFVSKKGEYTHIGAVKIQSLEVKAYKGLIYDILVITEYHPDLYKGLVRNFGEAEFAIRSNKYFWSTPSVRLTFAGLPKNKLELHYFSYLLKDRLKAEAAAQVESIADDF